MLAIYELPFVTAIDRALYDKHLENSLSLEIDQNVVIANIDEKSIAELGQWPWRRDVLSQFLDTLFEHYEIKAIGFDVVFSEPSDNVGQEVLDLLAQSDLADLATFKQAYSMLSPQLNFDGRFAASMKNRNVVLGIVFERGNKPNANALPPPLLTMTEDMTQNNNLVSAQSYIANLPLFHQVAAGSGFFDNPLLDDDGVLRRVPLVQRIEGHMYPSLSLELIRIALGQTSLEFKFEQVHDLYQIKNIEIGDNKVPVGSKGELLVPYRGPQASFAYLPIIDIMTQTLPVETLKNKIVLVGSDAAGLLDLRTTPFSKAYPGVEVHANVVSGVLENRLMQVPSYALSFEVSMIVLCTLLLLLLESIKDARVQVLGVLILIFILLVSNQYFWQQGKVLPLATSLVLSAALVIALSLMNMISETRQKLSIVKRFGQYVPPELVTRMSDEPEKYSLKNESKCLTVLFMDIRGFTSISEKMTPEQLSDYLNTFLTAMTEVIHKHKGTIDKYMGDAIMAFWGAPVDDENHAESACLAAIEMQNKLKELNLSFEQQGLPPIKVGIGINTDIMFVGNMGSSFRTAYTVMGDAVNLAARLEALTKQYGVTILIGENTQAAVSLSCAQIMPVDYVRVKGKDLPVKIFQLCDQLSNHECELFQQMLDIYRNQKWLTAHEQLQQLKSLNAISYELVSMYESRIDAFKKSPPDENWDGVFTHTSK